MIPFKRILFHGNIYKGKIFVTFFSTDKNELKLTDKCIQRLKEVLKKDEFLRVEVQGGGCSGFEYKFRFDQKLDKNQDIVFGKDKAKVVVDDVSMEYLKGATLDYTSELLRTSFKIINNPIAEKGCSCGSSFAPRLD
uniref:Iron-sulfur cluster assembly 2 homolog, mitochondrial n=1 Tax=Parastrongyloides trichosuri TaxID=131310 RepID=A0A0N5A539_PARTI